MYVHVLCTIGLVLKNIHGSLCGMKYFKLDNVITICSGVETAGHAGHCPIN